MNKQPPKLFYYTVNKYNKPETLQLAILLEVDYNAMLPYSIKSINDNKVYFVTLDGYVWECLGDTLDHVPHKYIGMVDKRSLDMALGSKPLNSSNFIDTDDSAKQGMIGTTLNHLAKSFKLQLK